MSFGRPYMLLLLGLIPLLLWLRGKPTRPAAVVYPMLNLLTGLGTTPLGRPGNFTILLRVLALGAIAVALAQPRLQHGQTTLRASGIDMVLVLDLSGTMASEDFNLGGKRINRLQLAKHVLAEFIRRRASDRLGLVAFAARPYVVSPLTLDHQFLLQNLQRLELGMIEDRTAIGSAIATAVNRLRHIDSKSKIVVLFTDGQNNAGRLDPITAAELAKTFGVKIYTVGVGSRGLAPMPVYSHGRKFGYQMVPVDIDEDTLSRVAELTGGKYYRATDAATLERICAEIDKLEKTTFEQKLHVQYRELFQWFAALGLGLVLLEHALRCTVFRIAPAEY